ncbi:MAG: hypothetical protein ACPL1F_00710, partial [bacterium]
MLKPKIKHKAAEISENQKEQTKKSFKLFIFTTILLYIVLSVLNNIYNSKFFNKQDKVILDGLEISFNTDKDKYDVGEKVTIYLTIKNTTSSKKEIKFNSPNIAYITVLRPVNLGLTKYYIKVWTNKTNTKQVPNPYSITLKPFEKLVFPTVWNQVDMNGQPVKTGRYRFIVE